MALNTLKKEMNSKLALKMKKKRRAELLQRR